MGSFAINVSSLYIDANVSGIDLSKRIACCKIMPLCGSLRKMSRAMPVCSFDTIRSIKSGFFDQKSFTKGLCEIAAKGIIGSLFFLSFVNVRQAVALPATPSLRIEIRSNKIDDNIDKVDDDIDKINNNIDGRDTGSSKGEPEDTANIEDANPKAINSEDEALYLKLLEQNPRDLSALQAVVLLKIRKRQHTEAVKYVEMLIDVEPDEVEWRLLGASIYEMMGQLSKSKRLFKEILKEWPLMFKALQGLAMVMTKKHEGPAVFEMLNEAVELASRMKRVNDERNIRILIIQMHLLHDNLDEALRTVEELHTQNPRDFRLYLLEGIIYSFQGKEKEAEKLFKIFQSLVPEDFPERGFLDDMILEAKTESRKQLDKRV